MVQENNHRKALKADSQQTSTPGRGRGHGCGQNNNDTGQGSLGGCNQPGHGHGCTGGHYHNWVPQEEYESMDQDSYNCLVHDRISHGEYQSNTQSTQSTSPSTMPSVPVTQVQVPPITPNVHTAPPSVISTPTSHNPTTSGTHTRTTNMVVVTPSPPLQSQPTSTSMDTGPNTFLWQLMSNASAHTPHPDTTSHSCTINHQSYHSTHQIQATYVGALVDSGANGGMAGSDTTVFSIVPHSHVDITGVAGDVMAQLPLVQCASIVDTVNKGKIILIMSQYANKPDTKMIHSKSQLEHFGCQVIDSASTAGGKQMVITMKGMLSNYTSIMAFLYGYACTY